MRGAHAVEVHVEEEPRRRLEFVQLLFNEHAVGTQVDVLAALEYFADELADFRIDHRFAAAQADDGSTAFIDGLQAFRHAQLLLDGGLVFANAAATGTRQVTGVQRFEHHYEWKFVDTSNALAGDVLGHACGQGQRKSHFSLRYRASANNGK